MIQITQRSVITIAAAQIARLRREFDEKHCVILPQLFSSGLIGTILQKIESAQFYRNRHRDRRGREFAWDLTVRENEMALHVIHFLLNNQEVFSSIQKITTDQEIGSYAGRIYRTLPHQGHRLDWHDDAEHSERMLGISVNLSSEHYAGGLFQLREKQSERVLCEVGSGNLGDAHVFRISPQLQHRVTQVEGEQARTSAAGWFLSEPDHLTALKNLSRPTTTIEERAS
jgi:hypothetical protein